MDNNKRLLDNIRRAAGGRRITVYQGIVRAVDGITCTCVFGSLEVSGIRLRASLSDVEGQMLITPKVGSAVIVGSLSGDLSNVAVLSVDEIESIEINGGGNGGLINIQTLTDRINALVDKFNSHTHTLQTGAVAVSGPSGASSNPQPITVPAVTSKADRLSKDDYEDTTIKH